MCAVPFTYKHNSHLYRRVPWRTVLVKYRFDTFMYNMECSSYFLKLPEKYTFMAFSIHSEVYINGIIKTKPYGRYAYSR